MFVDVNDLSCNFHDNFTMTQHFHSVHQWTYEIIINKLIILYATLFLIHH